MPVILEKYDVPATFFLFGVGWVLIAVFVLLCGWVEDVAARERPRLLPGGGAARMGP